MFESHPAYSAYFDASHSNGMMSVGGLVLSSAKVVRFNREWSTVLEMLSLPYFHMTDFASRRRAFQGWSDDRRQDLFVKLTDIVRRYAKKLVFSAVESDSWNRVDKEFELSETWNCPFVFTCSGAAHQVALWAKRKGRDCSVRYLFEDGDREKGALIQHCQLHKAFTPEFMDKKTAYPCQAADLIAWKTRVTATETRKLPTGSQSLLRPILKSLRQIQVAPQSGGIFSGEMLRKMCIDCGFPTRPFTATA